MIAHPEYGLWSGPAESFDLLAGPLRFLGRLFFLLRLLRWGGIVSAGQEFFQAESGIFQVHPVRTARMVPA